jgi:predicted ABC-type ATPase
VASRRRPVIHVLAGVNGAGKSSIGGATVRAAGGEYFNPDEAARRIRAETPALAAGFEVRIWFVGLESPELHLARVRALVKAGGHDIPEPAVRARFDASRLNLIGLLPVATEVLVYDNTAEADPRRGVAPQPPLLLHTVRGMVREHAPLEAVPDWAKPIIAAAFGLA